MLPAYGHDLGPGKLSPRERVYTALAFRQPDRTPADLWAVPEVQERLKRHFHTESWEEVLQRLNVDVRWVAPDYVGPQRTLPGGVTVGAYGSWRRTQRHSFGSYEEYASFPLAEARTADDVHAWDWPRTEYWDVSRIPNTLAQWQAQGDYFVCYDLGGIFERSWGLLGLERFLMDLVENPEVPCAIMDHMTDLYIDNVTRVLKAGQGRIHMVYTWDDLAHQHSLLMSRQMWRKYIVPRHQRLNIIIRAFDVKLMYHSCGAIYPLVGDLIRDLGIDVLQSLQPQADGMDMERLKQEFGQRLAFHGGVDIQHTLPHGTPQQVSEEVRQRVQVLGRGGGYILSAAHYIQNDTPTENILAMYRTPRELA
jgi:uroporphyrinogen decarboxylase